MTFPRAQTPVDPPAGSWSPNSSAELEMIGSWVANQRWYANKGALPLLERIGGWTMPAQAPGVELVTHLFLDHTVGKPALYQVPIVYRATQSNDAGTSIGELNGRHLYDGPHDAEYASALLDFILREHEVTGDKTWVIGSRSPGDKPTAALHSRVLTGEQSNTSIIFESDASAAAPVILKLFRAIHHGENPDVELQTALAAAGSDAVPRPTGHVLAEWDDRGQPTGRARGHLAFAQEFLPAAEDAWRIALDSAADGRDFSTEAYALGVATAGVHGTLAVAMPTRPATTDDIAATITEMHGRLAAAIAEVPALSTHAAAIEAVFATARTADWPYQQRIHGDLHLGQVLGVPGRSWVLVDFEGEPLRPMPERSRLDNPLRDVAGMLRSFDYVAGSIAVSAGVDAPAAHRARVWASRARAAFEEGYAAASGQNLVQNRALLDAFELDKALYETVYEARNRPDWLAIPVAAIERLVTRAPAG
ncbi:MAG: phosphotransferase [Rhodoglobus sp.]